MDLDIKQNLITFAQNYEIMASIRNLKKDIDFLTNEIIGDSFLAVGFHGEKVKTKVNELLENVVELHNDLFDRINKAPTDRKSKEAKAHFHAIRTEIDKKYREMYDKLSGIIAEK
jgi:hypothetical protein